MKSGLLDVGSEAVGAAQNLVDAGADRRIDLARRQEGSASTMDGDAYVLSEEEIPVEVSQRIPPPLGSPERITKARTAHKSGHLLYR